MTSPDRVDRAVQLENLLCNRAVEIELIALPVGDSLDDPMFEKGIEVSTDCVAAYACRLGQFALHEFTIRGRQQRVDNEVEALGAILHEIQLATRMLVAELFRTSLRIFSLGHGYAMVDLFSICA